MEQGPILAPCQRSLRMRISILLKLARILSLPSALIRPWLNTSISPTLNSNLNDNFNTCPILPATTRLRWLWIHHPGWRFQSLDIYTQLCEIAVVSQSLGTMPLNLAELLVLHTMMRKPLSLWRITVTWSIKAWMSSRILALTFLDSFNLWCTVSANALHIAAVILTTCLLKKH